MKRFFKFLWALFIAILSKPTKRDLEDIAGGLFAFGFIFGSVALLCAIIAGILFLPTGQFKMEWGVAGVLVLFIATLLGCEVWNFAELCIPKIKQIWTETK